jgi:hypothetical protein
MPIAVPLSVVLELNELATSPGRSIEEGADDVELEGGGGGWEVAASTRRPKSELSDMEEGREGELMRRWRREETR